MEIQLTSIYNTYIFSSIDSTDFSVEFVDGEKCSIFINNKLVELDLEENKSISSNTNGYIQLYINPYTNTEEFELLINYDDKEYNVYYQPNKSNYKNYYSEHQQNINNERSSFMLLRTNPKLTGNIKVVVDSDNNLFLDTFQINKTLSKKEYRHIPISGNSKYSNDIRNNFSSIPKNELFKVSDEVYDLFNIKQDFSSQYNDTYFYGVKNNFDKLYNENFSLLAPLYINHILPDFFVIFRVDGPINDYKPNISPKEIFDIFLREGKIVKTFDLRENTNVGNYIRNIQEDIINYPTSVYMSMDQYNHNQWTGISIDRGIITTATESGYLLTEVKNQVDYDRYITNGFERNGLVSSRIINFEFMFDDKSSIDFKINRYFGLYLFNHKVKDVNILEQNKELVKKLTDNFDNKIINLTNNIDDSFIRIKNINDYIVYPQIKGKEPSNNILSINAKYNDVKNKKIMNININSSLKPGEHLRVIDEQGKNVYEIVVSKCDNEDYYKKNKDAIINYDEDITFYRNIISGYTNDYQITIEEQLKQLKESFNSILPNYVEVYTYDNNLNFIVKSDNTFYFQRVSSRVLYDYEIIANLKNVDENNTITYFDKIIPSMVLNAFKKEKDIFSMTHFNSWNNRLSYIVEFTNLKDEDIYNISQNVDVEDKLLISINENQNSIYKPLSTFDVNYKSISDDGTMFDMTFKKYTIKSPNTKNNFIIKSYTTNNTLIEKINLYTYDKCQLNIAGIMPIKDFNFDVIDDSNIIQTQNTYEKIKGVDEYSNDIIFNGITVEKIRKGASPENFYQYIDLTTNNNIYNKTNCISFMNNIYNQKKKMDIPLIVPTNCKWKIFGKDIVNNNIKSSPFSPQGYSYNLQETCSYYNIFSSELTNINEVTNLIKKNDNEYISIRDYLLYDKGNPYDILSSEYFTKLYYNITSNSLEVIYSGQKMQLYNNSLSLSEYEGYTFAIVKSKSNLLLDKPIEIIIDKENEVILCIWYIGGYYNNDWIKSNAISDMSVLFNNKYIPFIDIDGVDIEGKDVFLSCLNNDIIEKECCRKNTYSFTVDSKNNYAIHSDKYLYFTTDPSTKKMINKETEIINTTDIKPNIYIKNDDHISIKNNIETFKNIVNKIGINLYIKDATNLINSDINIKFIAPTNIRETLPLKVLSNTPYSTYYTYNGYIQPEFKNIFEFDNVDDEVSNISNINFIGTNTSISKINNLNQLWINKISDDINYSFIKNEEINEENAILSIDFIKNVSVVRGCWDEKFYHKYTRNKPVVSKNGYESFKDVKTFFGSHAIVTNLKEIIIDDFSNYYFLPINIKKNKDGKTKVKLNISDALLNHIKNNTNIITNWTNGKKVLYKKYDEYIKNIIDNVYPIDSSNKIEVFSIKDNNVNSNNTFNIIPFNEKYTYDTLKNIETNLIKENDKYYLVLEFNDVNCNYAIKYTIKK